MKLLDIILVDILNNLYSILPFYKLQQTIL